jgi:hypothetical protein
MTNPYPDLKSILLACLMCVLLPEQSVLAQRTGTAGGDGMSQVVVMVRSERYADALATADSLGDPTTRAQARLYVLHQAGDLAGALRAGIDGLASAPNDLWLLERVCYIAISLRATELANEYLTRFARAAERSELDRSRWRALEDDYRRQVDVLLATDRERERALLRARVVVAGAAVGLLVLFAGLARRRSPKASASLVTPGSS